MSDEAERLIVEVQRDHLQTLAKVRRPTVAIAELIWNALDADARLVTVTLKESAIGGIDSIEVKDDGEGISWETAQKTFKNLGGSWKRTSDKTRAGRKLHGAKGQGRFRAFGIGRRVTWESFCESENGDLVGIQITGDHATIQHFELSPLNDGRRRTTGTRVRIKDIDDDGGLVGEGPVAHLAETFTPYMLQYPSVRIRYNGAQISPAKYIKKSTEVTVRSVLAVDDDDGNGERAPEQAPEAEPIEAILHIVEWNTNFDRKLHLCNGNGFTLAEFPMRIRAPGMSFSAYLRSDLFEQYEESGVLDLAELHPVVRALTQSARDALKNYYSDRRLEEAGQRLEKWKEEKIYPFADTDNNGIDEARRKVFDMCAVQIDERLPGFSQEDIKSKRLTFSLLKKAIDRDPDDTRRIVSEVLGLSDEEKKDFAELLENTSLRSIIQASKTVAERLEFLVGLETLVFDYKSRLKERSQLHKLIEENGWIFGEEFHLTNSDETLTKVLRKCMEEKGLDPRALDPVVPISGKAREIIDLALCRRVPMPNGDRHHLVVELKAPTVSLNEKVLSQTKGYAYSVANDERFMHTRTRWTFWMVSNKMNPMMEWEIDQDGREFGQIYKKKNVEIWAMTWGQLIQSCQARMKFFKESLEYSPSTESAMKYLNRVYPQFVPPPLAKGSKSR